jgi:cyclic GMP-AMP synthase DncV-like protein/adenylyl/guanylyl cyclase-like protein with sensor domain
MGIAASLFHSTANPKRTLDWRIRPSDDQYEQQQERWRDVAEYLVEDLKERSGYTLNWWLQGSYKFGTQVRPPSTGDEFDIDLGIYFRWDGADEDGNHGPAELKGFVRESLTDYADDEANEADKISDPKPRCERLHFKPDFHIDVPCYHLHPSQDARSLATQDDEWEESDPKAIYKWWKDTFGEDVRPRLRRLVRYMKMWAALNFGADARPSSILLTVLVGEAWSAMDTDAPSGDDEYLVEVVRTIIARLERNAAVPNPAARRENLNRLDQAKSNGFIDGLRELLSVGERALAAQSKTAAAEIWAEVFQHFFPLPDEDDSDSAVLKEAGRALIPIVFDPQVAVTAVPKKRTDRVFRGTNQIGPIPKDCSLTFTLMNEAELPYGATLSWTVRNEGDEAEDENDLGHVAGNTAQVEERSAYRGTHHMDLAVRLNGRVIGRRRIPVTVTRMFMPLRNPPRPSWASKHRR